MSLPEYIRSGAMPGMDAVEQERWAIEVGYGDLPATEAAKIADRLLTESDGDRADATARGKNAHDQGLPRGYGSRR